MVENIFDLYHPSPLLLVISGPSGVGKDVVLQSLKQRKLQLHFVVTATTRKPRPGEVDGVDYFFVTVEKFLEMIQNNEFLEYAKVYDDYKGIPLWQIEQAFSSGQDVIIRVDVQGAATLRSKYPGAVLIFLIPSNEGELVTRLLQRGSETPESLALRLANARKELGQLGIFDYIIVNAQDQLSCTVEAIINIIQAEHHSNPHRVIQL